MMYVKNLIEKARNEMAMGNERKLREIENELSDISYMDGDIFAAHAANEALGMRVILARRNPIRRIFLKLAGF